MPILFYVPHLCTNSFFLPYSTSSPIFLFPPLLDFFFFLGCLSFFWHLLMLCCPVTDSRGIGWLWLWDWRLWCSQQDQCADRGWPAYCWPKCTGMLFRGSDSVFTPLPLKRRVIKLQQYFGKNCEISQRETHLKNVFSYEKMGCFSVRLNCIFTWLNISCDTAYFSITVEYCHPTL